MKLTNKQKGELGEILVSMELMNMGLDVVNINTVYRNYKNADLICMNANNGKSVMIQVKTGTTHNILTGFTSEFDGTIQKLEESIIGPWVFVYMPDDKMSNMEFYILTREEVIEYIRSVKEQVDANVVFMQEQEAGIETKRLVYPEYRRNLCEKTGTYTWEDYEEKVKSVALLLLELNADLLTPAQREKLGIPEFEFIDQIGAEDKISTIIDNKDFNDACRVEDELAYQEARELVRRAKEIKPEVYPSDPEAITTEDIVGIMESELKVITERKDAIENLRFNVDISFLELFVISIYTNKIL